jgi:hypothetical protein
MSMTLLQTLNWPEEIAYFFGGLFLTNCIPHLVSGLMGRPFQSPFAKPPGQGLSSSTANVIWGLLNLGAAYGLLVWVGRFDIRAPQHVGAVAIGVLLISLFTARHFGRFNGGNSPGKA